MLYLARDPAIDHLVAIKLLRVNQAEIRERFLREAQLVGRLQHPNIVTVYDIGEHEGQPFIVMQLLEGQTLREWIDRATPENPALRLDRLLNLGVQIADGLNAAHQRGIIHRDIKPANMSNLAGLSVRRLSGLTVIRSYG